MNLRQLLDPHSIAVIGASGTEGKIGYAAMKNALGFDGPVHPVNPKRAGDVLFDHDVVGSVADIDGDVDLALLCVPPAVVPGVIVECGDAGVGGAVIYSGGYSEANEEGAQLEQKIADIANDNRISLLGPNTSGFINPRSNLCASFVPHMDEVEAGPVAVVAQSGGINHGIAFKALSDRRGVSKAIGLGNQANTGFAEVIGYLDEDDDTEAIILHVEGADDPRKLLEVSERADVPVCAYKVGREDVDDFAASHTGAMTGNYELYQAGFKQYGVVSADSCTEVFDAGNALAKSPEPHGTNVGVVSAQAGPGIVMTDRLKRVGANLPELSNETQQRIGDLVSDITFTENPVDTGRPMEEIDEVIAAVADDDAIDIILMYELYEAGVPYPIEGLTEIAEDCDKPLVFATDGPWNELEDDIKILERAGIPSYVTPERGAEAVGALVQYFERNELGVDASGVTADD